MSILSVIWTWFPKLLAFLVNRSTPKKACKNRYIVFTERLLNTSQYMEIPHGWLFMTTMGSIHVFRSPHTIHPWVRNKSCQPDLHFSEQTDIAGGTTTLQLGTDVVDLDSGDSPDVTSSDVEDDVNLRGRVLIVLSQACDSLILTPPLQFSDGLSARTHMAPLTPRSNHRVSLSIILNSSKSVLCPLTFKWSKTAETLDPEVCCCNLLRSGWDVSPM